VGPAVADPVAEPPEAGSWPDVATLDVGSVNVAPGGTYTSPHNPFGSNAATLPAATPFTGNINYFVSPWTKNPYSEQYNLGIEQQFGASTIFAINYVGSSTHRLDIGGYFHSENMRVIERLHREGNTLTWQATVEDPDVLLKPWAMSPRTLKLNPDPKAVLAETLPCVEKDLSHLVTKEHH